MFADEKLAKLSNPAAPEPPFKPAMEDGGSIMFALLGLSASRAASCFCVASAWCRRADSCDSLSSATRYSSSCCMHPVYAVYRLYDSCFRRSNCCLLASCAVVSSWSLFVSVRLMSADWSLSVASAISRSAMTASREEILPFPASIATLEVSDVSWYFWLRASCFTASASSDLFACSVAARAFFAASASSFASRWNSSLSASAFAFASSAVLESFSANTRASCAAALSRSASSVDARDFSASALDLSASRFQSATAVFAPASSVLSCEIWPLSIAALASASFATASSFDLEAPSLFTKSALSFLCASRASRVASSLRSSSPTALECAKDTSLALMRSSASVAWVCSSVAFCTAAACFMSAMVASFAFSALAAACLSAS
mmetsp:Transcript_2670/g.10586  ORF Transcript_2670/g.10586 Transcript_2670/m.10586 type:complete len:378 (-) Transcript_2670:1264-2397(-)